MATLDGTGTTIDIAPGYRLAAPGLIGTATAVQPRAYGGADRGPEVATEAFDRALAASNVTEVLNIDLTARKEALPPGVGEVRTARGEEGLVLETPDLGEAVGQVVMAIDDDGAVTWNFPEDDTGAMQTPATRGAGGSKRFVIRTTTPPPSPEGAADRGLFGAIGRKVLKVLVYPIADAVLGSLADGFAAAWERKFRPYLVRTVTPDNYREAGAGEFTASEWDTMSAGRSLLFVHGTFSSTHSGFFSLPRPTVEELVRRYEGRVFGFDHHTLSATPEENVAEFASRMPGGINLDVDIVSHSRGGLVSRCFANELGSAPPGFTVGKAVFVGTPNHGTKLANADHMINFIDRYTSALNLVPPGPVDVVAEILEAILAVVKTIGHALLKGLSGLSAQDPTGAFIGRINGSAGSQATYHAITANYEPTGGLLALVKQGISDALFDAVFEDAPNDLIVPTLGVYEATGNASFPIPPDRLHSFGTGDGVTHTTYFGSPTTSETLTGWLTG
jgi:hypothetical protein